MLKVDPEGFDELDRRLLRLIIENFDGGPVGVESLAAALSEERGTLEDVIEPYLIQQGFLVRTARGRMATAKAYRHLGLKPLKAGARAVRGERRCRLSNRPMACGSVGRHACIGKIPTPVAWSTTRNTLLSWSARAPNGCVRGHGQEQLRDDARPGFRGPRDAAGFPAPGAAGRPADRDRAKSAPASAPACCSRNPSCAMAQVLLTAEVRVAVLSAASFRPKPAPDALYEEFKALEVPSQPLTQYATRIGNLRK